MSASIASEGDGTRVTGEAATADLAAICRRALYDPDDVAALEALRAHARWIAAHLGDEAICEALTVEPPGSVSDDRVAAVYDVLARAEPGAILPVDTGGELIAASLDEEREIGLAFRDELLDGLAPALKNLVVYFAAVPRVSRKEERRLLQTASVDAAWPESGGLVACGLTPLSVFYASRNVASLVRRSRGTGTLGGDPPTLEPFRGAGPPGGPHDSLSRRVAREVVQVNRCSEQAASTLVDWLIEVARVKHLVFAVDGLPSVQPDHDRIEVARVKHLVFAGYRAEPEGAGVRLIAHEDYSDRPLRERWRETRPAPPEPPVWRPDAGAAARAAR